MKKQILLFVFLFAICEIGSRIWLSQVNTETYCWYARFEDIPQKYFNLMPHPYISFYTTPGHYFRQERKDRLDRGVRYHNSLGYRNEELDEREKIVIFGGSTAYDISIVDNKKTFAYQLEKQFKGKYQVVNAAISGSTSWETLSNFQYRVLELKPKLIIINDGINDLYARFVRDYKSDGTGHRRVWHYYKSKFWERSCFLRCLMRKLRITRQLDMGVITTDGFFHFTDNPFKVLESHPPIYFERNLRSIIAIAKEHNIKVLIPSFAYCTKKILSGMPVGYNSPMTLPHFIHGIAEMNDVIRRVSRDAMYYDHKKYMPTDRRFWYDGVHNSEAGALYKAKLFYKYLKNRI